MTTDAKTHRVDALADYEFDMAAAFAADQLRHHHHAFVSLSPGDATNYKIVIVQPLVAAHQHPEYCPTGFKPVNEYWVGTTFGALYQWNPDIRYTWDYVADKWIAGRPSHGEWTARVICRFLNALRDALAAEVPS